MTDTKDLCGDDIVITKKNVCSACELSEFVENVSIDCLLDAFDEECHFIVSSNSGGNPKRASVKSINVSFINRLICLYYIEDWLPSQNTSSFLLLLCRNLGASPFVFLWQLTLLCIIVFCHTNHNNQILPLIDCRFGT